MLEKLKQKGNVQHYQLARGRHSIEVCVCVVLGIKPKILHFLESPPLFFSLSLHFYFVIDSFMCSILAQN